MPKEILTLQCRKQKEKKKEKKEEKRKRKSKKNPHITSKIQNAM
jgi:hypothetical protein